MIESRGRPKKVDVVVAGNVGSIDLQPFFRGSLVDGIRPMSAIWRADRSRVTFAVVRYAARRGGEWQEEDGAVLDMDKRVFIHHPENKGHERYLKDRSRWIARIIGEHIYPKSL